MYYQYIYRKNIIREQEKKFVEKYEKRVGEVDTN